MKSKSQKFIDNCKRLLETPNYIHLYFEFLNGGDEFYRNPQIVDIESWEKWTIEEKADFAEKNLNKKELRIRYPGTFSGPGTDDLQILIGLDNLEVFECDTMQVTTFTTLLELPRLEKVQLDIFSHTTGYIQEEWSVFDALIFIHCKPNEFRCRVENISKYRNELDLNRKFGIYGNLPAQGEELDLQFLTREFLYQKFSL